MFPKIRPFRTRHFFMPHCIYTVRLRTQSVIQSPVVPIPTRPLVVCGAVPRLSISGTKAAAVPQNNWEIRSRSIWAPDAPTPAVPVFLSSSRLCRLASLRCVCGADASSVARRCTGYRVCARSRIVHSDSRGENAERWITRSTDCSCSIHEEPEHIVDCCCSCLLLCIDRHARLRAGNLRCLLRITGSLKIRTRCRAKPDVSPPDWATSIQRHPRTTTTCLLSSLGGLKTAVKTHSNQILQNIAELNSSKNGAKLRQPSFNLNNKNGWLLYQQRN